jgi:hypothetical protein
MGFESLTFGSAVTHVGSASYIASVLERQVENLMSSAETQRVLTQKLYLEIESLKQRIDILESDKK